MASAKGWAGSEGIETTVLVATTSATTTSCGTQLIRIQQTHTHPCLHTCKNPSGETAARSVERSGIKNAAQKKNAKASMDSMEHNVDVLVLERF